jgi:hypothetical protein
MLKLLILPFVAVLILTVAMAYVVAYSREPENLD